MPGAAAQNATQTGSRNYAPGVTECVESFRSNLTFSQKLRIHDSVSHRVFSIPILVFWMSWVQMLARKPAVI